MCKDNPGTGGIRAKSSPKPSPHGSYLHGVNKSKSRCSGCGCEEAEAGRGVKRDKAVEVRDCRQERGSWEDDIRAEARVK